MTTIEWLHQFDPQASQEEMRGILGQMLFSGDDAHKPTQALSGGESARLVFCQLMLQKPNSWCSTNPPTTSISRPSTPSTSPFSGMKALSSWSPTTTT